MNNLDIFGMAWTFLIVFAGDYAAASPAEAQRFTQDPFPAGEVLYTTSNSWLEVNYTQLVANVKEILPQIKPGAIPVAMVKVSSIWRASISFLLDQW